MARRLSPQEDRLLHQTLFDSELSLPSEDDLLLQNFAAKGDQELWLSAELRELVEGEFPLPPFFR